MSNRSYLIVGSHQALSNHGKGADESDPAECQTIADQAYGVPLLWLAPFTPEQMDYKPVEEDTPEAGRLVLTTERAKALQQLRATAPQLASYFTDAQGILRWIDLLHQQIESAPGSDILLDLTEIATMDDPDYYAERLTECLQWISNPPPVSAPTPPSFFARLLGARPAVPRLPKMVHQIVDWQSGFDETAKIPTTDELRQARRNDRSIDTLCSLLVSWDEAFS